MNKGRLQFRHYPDVFDSRESAYQYLADIVNSAYAIDKRLDKSLIGEPLVVVYSGSTGANALLCIGVSGETGAEESALTPYQIIDIALVNEEIAELSGITGNIQAELDRTQIGAGLDDDGNYIPNANANYISGATSLKNADDVLDTELARVDEAVKHLVDDVITGVVFDNVTASVVNNTAILNVSADTIPIGPYDEYVGPATVPHRIHDHYTVLDAVKQVDVNFDELRITKVPAQELGPNIKEAYRLIGKTATNDEGVKGETIYIYKDSSIVEIYLGTSADTVNETTGVIDKKQGDKEFLNYVYYTVNGEYRMTKIDLEDFLTEPEFKSGVTVTNHIAHGVVDPSSETFLTVGADGFKLSGVQDAIDATVALEETRAIAAENAISANVDALSSATITFSANTIAALDDLSADLEAEIARAIAAENAISGAVNSFSSSTVMALNDLNNDLALLSGNVVTLESSFETPGSYKHTISDVFKTHTTQGTPVEADKTLMKHYVEGNEKYYYVSSDTDDMYYSGEQLTRVIDSIKTNIDTLQEQINTISGIVQDMQADMPSLVYNAVKDILAGTNREIKVTPDDSTEKITIGYADDAVFGPISLG